MVNLAQVVDRNTGEVLEHNTPLLVSLPPQAVSSILSALVSHNETLTREANELLEFAVSQRTELNVAEEKNTNLEKAMDSYHDRMEFLQEELNLVNDHLYSVSGDTYTELYHLQHENSELSKALADAQIKIENLEKDLAIEKDIANFLHDELDDLNTDMERMESYLANGYYNYDDEWNVIDEDDIPPSAFIIHEEGYADAEPVENDNREVDLYA